MDHGTSGIRRCRRGWQRGFTYIALLIFIAVLGVGLAAVSEVWSVQLTRDKEEELLYTGDQIRDAIAMYSRQGAGAGGRFPGRLEDLLKDPRSPATRRYLRKIYPDPITGSTKWELVQGPNGEVLGVHSTSDKEPLKKAGFSLADRQFEGATKYSDWVFVISPMLNLAPPSAIPPGASAGQNSRGVPGVSAPR